MLVFAISTKLLMSCLVVFGSLILEGYKENRLPKYKIDEKIIISALLHQKRLIGLSALHMTVPRTFAAASSCSCVC
jgi:hypothetical protein